MKTLKKPEKKSDENVGEYNQYRIWGYNQACDDWQAYHEQEIEKLQEERLALIRDLVDCATDLVELKTKIKELQRLNKLLEEEVNIYINAGDGNERD